MIKVIGRCLDGVKVVGYVVEKKGGSRGILNKQEVEKLVLTKQVDNVSGQIYEGRVNLRGVGFRLVDLPKYGLDGVSLEDRAIKEVRGIYSLRARIVRGRSIIGYVAQRIGENGEYEEKKLSREQVMVLASTGKIANVRVQRNNGTPILRGKNKELEGLPIIKLS